MSVGRQANNIKLTPFYIFCLVFWWLFFLLFGSLDGFSHGLANMSHQRLQLLHCGLKCGDLQELTACLVECWRTKTKQTKKTISS